MKILDSTWRDDWWDEFRNFRDADLPHIVYEVKSTLELCLSEYGADQTAIVSDREFDEFLEWCMANLEAPWKSEDGEPVEVSGCDLKPGRVYRDDRQEAIWYADRNDKFWLVREGPDWDMYWIGAEAPCRSYWFPGGSLTTLSPSRRSAEIRDVVSSIDDGSIL